METLQITLFGHVSVIHPHASAPQKPSRSIQAFLAYLLLQPHLVPREVLMDVFWIDYPPDRARSNLTTALWRLRQMLEPGDVRPGTYLITRTTGAVGFNRDSDHWLDTESFQQHICPLLRKPISDLSDGDISVIEQVLTLYRGELLEGMYEDWALRERERFRSLHLNSLARLMECYAARGNFEQSIALAHEILRRDPVREEIHRALMRIYLQSGQRPLAVRQYVHCRDVLQREMGVPPLEETQILYQRVIASSPAGVLPAGEPAGHPGMAQLAHELELVKQNLAEATRALERIQRAMSSYTSNVPDL